MFANYEPPRTHLRAWRTVKNLTMYELAEKAGLNPATVWRLETSFTNRPRPATARKLADALGITVFDLYRDPLKEG